MSSTRTLFINLKQPKQVVKFAGVSQTIQSIELYAYSIKGVPVIEGQPEDLFVNFNMEPSGSIGSLNWLRSDLQTIAALPITDAFTHDHLASPVLISGQHKHNGTYTITLTRPNGTDAVFTDAAFWFHIKF